MRVLPRAKQPVVNERRINLGFVLEQNFRCALPSSLAKTTAARSDEKRQYSSLSMSS